MTFSRGQQKAPDRIPAEGFDSHPAWWIARIRQALFCPAYQRGSVSVLDFICMGLTHPPKKRGAQDSRE